MIYFISYLISILIQRWIQMSIERKYPLLRNHFLILDITTGVLICQSIIIFVCPAMYFLNPFVKTSNFILDVVLILLSVIMPTGLCLLCGYLVIYIMIIEHVYSKYLYFLL